MTQPRQRSNWKQSIIMQSDASELFSDIQDYEKDSGDEDMERGFGEKKFKKSPLQCNTKKSQVSQSNKKNLKKSLKSSIHQQRMQQMEYQSSNKNDFNKSSNLEYSEIEKEDIDNIRDLQGSNCSFDDLESDVNLEEMARFHKTTSQIFDFHQSQINFKPLQSESSLSDDESSQQDHIELKASSIRKGNQHLTVIQEAEDGLEDSLNQTVIMSQLGEDQIQNSNQRSLKSKFSLINEGNTSAKLSQNRILKSTLQELVEDEKEHLEDYDDQGISQNLQCESLREHSHCDYSSKSDQEIDFKGSPKGKDKPKNELKSSLKPQQKQQIEKLEPLKLDEEEQLADMPKGFLTRQLTKLHDDIQKVDNDMMIPDFKDLIDSENNGQTQAKPDQQVFKRQQSILQDEPNKAKKPERVTRRIMIAAALKNSVIKVNQDRFLNELKCFNHNVKQTQQIEQEIADFNRKLELTEKLNQSQSDLQNESGANLPPHQGEKCLINKKSFKMTVVGNAANLKLQQQEQQKQRELELEELAKIEKHQEALAKAKVKKHKGKHTHQKENEEDCISHSDDSSQDGSQASNDSLDNDDIRYKDNHEGEEQYHDEQYREYKKLTKNQKCIILPNNKYKSLWDNLCALLIIYVIIFLPFKYGFFEDDEFPSWDVFDQVIDVMFGVDLVLTFFTSYTNVNDELIFKHSQIACNYLKFWFWMDLVSVFPFDVFFQTGQYASLARLSRLPKLYKLIKISKILRTMKVAKNKNNIFRRLYNFINIWPGFDRLIINLFSITIFCHVFACIWHLAAELEDSNNTWIWRLGLIDKGPFERYMASLYWITQTVITVGYGDIGAETSQEQLLAIFAMFVGVIFFSLIIGSLTSLITDSDQKKKKFDQKLNQLILLKKKYNIDNQLFEKVTTAIKWGVYRKEQNYNDFLAELPQNIRTQISYAMHKNTLASIKFFQGQPNKLIAYVGPMLSTIKFSQNEIIFTENEYANEMYFIKKGTVSLALQEFDNFPYRTIDQGYFFGEIDLIFGQTRKFSMVAITDVELLKLNKEDFEQTFLKDFQDIGKQILYNAVKRRSRQVKAYQEAYLFCENLERREQEEQNVQLKQNEMFIPFRTMNSQVMENITEEMQTDEDKSSPSIIKNKLVQMNAIRQSNSDSDKTTLPAERQHNSKELGKQGDDLTFDKAIRSNMKRMGTQLLNATNNKDIGSMMKGIIKKSIPEDGIEKRLHDVDSQLDAQEELLNNILSKLNQPRKKKD